MKKSSYILLIMLSILASCAQIVAPTGGAKDETGPKVLNTNPSNKSLNFPLTKQNITIKFDEFIQLKDASKQIVMSPPPNIAPDYSISGKELLVNFKEPLLANTTYTINFGNSITDNHEASIAKDLTYTFSTGNHIDSNFIAGIVKLAFTNEPIGDVIVSLYKPQNFTDTTIFKTNPTYFTKTKPDGTFKIENMPSDEYKIFAYRKEGIDLKYAKNDSVAIALNTVKSSNEEEKNILYLFKPNEYKVNKVMDTSSTQSGIYNIALYKPLNYTLTNLSSNTSIQRVVIGNKNIDTIKVFSTKLDSCTFQFKTADTSYQFTIKTKKKTALSDIIINAKTEITLNDTLKIKLSSPYSRILMDSIEFKEDTLKIKPSYFNYSSSNPFQIDVYHNWKESTNYSLKFKDSAITNIYNKPNKSTVIQVNTKQTKDYGTLILNIEFTPNGKNYLFQLINKGGTEVVKEFYISKSTQLKLEYLNPAELKVKLVEDLNNNGLWDNGDIDKKILPERTFNYNQIFNIRAYWDLEQNVNINDIINQQ